MRPKLWIKGTLSINESIEGETIEQQVERLVNNKEPIKDGAPLVYTERKDGVRAEMNVRTDRWEIAIDAMDKVSASYKARREDRINQREKEKNDSGAEPIQGTDGNLKIV